MFERKSRAEAPSRIKAAWITRHTRRSGYGIDAMSSSGDGYLECGNSVPGVDRIVKSKLAFTKVKRDVDLEKNYEKRMATIAARFDQGGN
jgi:hypothetical protein